MDDYISRQDVIDAVNEIINRFEQILRDIRESKVDDSVCGMCEYDGAYIGQSGDWCNECPGFDKDDCFKLSYERRKRWLESVNMPSAQPERKKGEWIEDGYSHYKAVCSECGEPCATYVMNDPRDRFCKWCGADMRNEE